MLSGCVLYVRQDFIYSALPLGCWQRPHAPRHRKNKIVFCQFSKMFTKFTRLFFCFCLKYWITTSTKLFIHKLYIINIQQHSLPNISSGCGCETNLLMTFQLIFSTKPWLTMTSPTRIQCKDNKCVDSSAHLGSLKIYVQFLKIVPGERAVDSCSGLRI